jgi:hypothetical protein
MKILIYVLVVLVCTGCSITTVDRGDNGGLIVTHKTFFIKTEAPSLEVERDNVNEYNAKFNAKSRGGDIEAMAKILEMFMAAQVGASIPDG